MSFTAYFRSANWQFPSGITYLAAGWTYIQFFAFDRPPTGYKEISQSEFKATPVQYLQDPEHHRVRYVQQLELWGRDRLGMGEDRNPDVGRPRSHRQRQHATCLVHAFSHAYMHVSLPDRFPKVPGQSTVTDNHTPHAHHH